MRTAERASVPEMVPDYRELSRLIPQVLSRAGTSSVLIDLCGLQAGCIISG
jgi:hypothetical protein